MLVLRRLVPAIFIASQLLWTGCADHAGAPTYSAALAALLADSTNLSWGVEDSPDSLQVFAGIRAAEFAPDGNSLFVVDRVAPFVRRLDLEGHPLDAFMRQGQGPGEGRFVNAVAVSEDVVAVVDVGLVSTFRLDGTPLASRVTLPVRVEYLERGCGDDWIIFGRPGQSGPDGLVPRVHRLRFTAAGPVLTTLHSDTGRSVLYRGRTLRVAAHASGGTVVLDDAEDPAEILWVPCDSDTATLVGTEDLDVATTVAAHRDEGREALELAPGARDFAGIGASRRGILIAETAGEVITIFEWRRPDGTVRSGAVRHVYRLKDMTDRYVLLQDGESDYPRLVAVPTDRLLDALTIE